MTFKLETDTKFIIDSAGEKIAAIILVNEYEDFLHRRHMKLELTMEYKNMIDTTFQQETSQTTKYLSLNDINTLQ